MHNFLSYRRLNPWLYWVNICVLYFSLSYSLLFSIYLFGFYIETLNEQDLEINNYCIILMCMFYSYWQFSYLPVINTELLLQFRFVHSSNISIQIPSRFFLHISLLGSGSLRVPVELCFTPEASVVYVRLEGMVIVLWIIWWRHNCHCYLFTCNNSCILLLK